MMLRRLVSAAAILAAFHASACRAFASGDGFYAPVESVPGLGLNWAYVAATVAAILVLGFKNAKRELHD